MTDRSNQDPRSALAGEMSFGNGFLAALIAASATLGSPHANSGSMALEIDPGGATRVRSDQWHLRFLNVGHAHLLSRGQGITVAVPDTGVDPHPDLRNNILPGIDIIPGGDGTGRKDRDSHGTGMAGLIAAHGLSDGTGALGIAPAARILPIYDSPPNGDGDPEALAEGIEFATRNSVDIISISSGGGSSPRLVRAVNTAIASNIVVIAAAGNKPDDTAVAYPASESGVIAVGGVDRDGQQASVSVAGPEVDVVAPAVDIYSTSIDGKYRKGTGTSSATAIVAGAAALIRSKYPDMSAREVAHRLTATAVDKGPPGRDDEYGYGVIDIVAALTADVPPLGSETPSATAPVADGPTATAAPGGTDDGATARGLVTLGVLVAVGVTLAVIVRRRRSGDDPPPRISR